MVKRNQLKSVARRTLIIISYICIGLSIKSCDPEDVIICDCFDDPDDAFSFTIDLKSYKTGMSINEFISSRDSSGKPTHYRIKVYTTDSTSFQPLFQWTGNGQQDSLARFIVWSPPKKITIDVDTIKLSHTFTEFIVEGFAGKSDCKCFTPTKKTVRMDDSITLDVLNTSVFLKKQ